MTTHADLYGAATTWVVSANTDLSHVLVYNLFLFTLFFGSRPARTGGPNRRHIRHMTCFRARKCLLGVSMRLFPFRGSNPPITPILWNRKSCILWKLFRRLQPNFCTVIKTTKCPSWVVQTDASQIHDDGWPPSWKNRKIAISQQRLDRSRSLALLSVPTVNISKI